MTSMTRKELIKRCSEVWPDTCFAESMFGEGIEDVEKSKDGTKAILCWSYVDDGPQYRFHYIHTKRGMKRRPQALAYVCGERDDFND